MTKKPDLSNYSGSVRVGGAQVDGGGAGYSVRGSASVPIVADTIALSASAFYRDDPGFVNNDFRGVRNINHDSAKGGRLSLRVKFTDGFETTLSGLVQNIDQLGPNLVYLNPNTLQPLSGKLSFSSAIDQSSSIESRSLSLNTILDLKFATLTNIASYAHVVAKLNLDYSLFATLLSAPPGTFVVAPADLESTRYSDEIRLTSSPGRLEWLLGGFYTHERTPDSFPIRGTDSAGAILPPSNSFYGIYNYYNDPLYEEKAIFGDVTYHLTDKLEFTGGARYSSNNQSYHYVGSGLLVGGEIVGQSRSSGSATTYLATVSYKLEPSMTLYARAASAYRPGGGNIADPAQIAAGAPLTFRADTLWNYEGGIKGSAWGQKITYSADIYHMVWSDIQLNVNFVGGTVVANASSAKSSGAEASLSLAPIDGLTVSFNGAYTDAKLTAGIPDPVFAHKGDPLPYSAKFSGSAVLDYRLPSFNSVVPRFGLTYAHRGSQNTSFTTGANYKLPSYDTLDVRGGVEWSRYSVLARIDNVANKYALTDAEGTVATNTPLGGVVIKPRTVGISFAAEF